MVLSLELCRLQKVLNHPCKHKNEDDSPKRLAQQDCFWGEESHLCVALPGISGCKGDWQEQTTRFVREEKLLRDLKGLIALRTGAS